MLIRMLKLYNNFPDNKMQGSVDVKTWGRFCCLGYFDSMDIHITEAGASQNTWDILEDISMSELNGTFSMEGLSCAYKDEDDEKIEKERRFWYEAVDEKPFYFIYLIRSATDELSYLYDLYKPDEQEDLIAYYTYEHTEAVIIYRTNAYSEGIKKLQELQEDFSASKTYTIFAVYEEVLKDKNKLEKIIKDETVNFRWKIVMKERKKVFEFFDMFLDKMKKMTVIQNNDFRIYDALGDEDIIVELDNIKLSYVLPEYHIGNLLTHNNRFYTEAFYNIETNIVIRGDMSDESKLDQKCN